MATTKTVDRKSVITNAQAVKLVSDYAVVRKQVRERLIAMARDNNPAATGSATHPGWSSTEVRKLYQFPSDLSDERLLKLATGLHPNQRVKPNEKEN
jgi:hypothetical protein